MGNLARQLRGSTPRGDVGSMNPVAHNGPPSCCSWHRDRQKSLCFGRRCPPLGVDASPDKGSLTAPGKGSAGDAAPSEDAAGVSKSILVRSRIWSTNSCTCASVDTPLAFWWYQVKDAVNAVLPLPSPP